MPTRGCSRALYATRAVGASGAHFRDEETEAQRGGLVCPKVSQVVSGGAGGPRLELQPLLSLPSRASQEATLDETGPRAPQTFPELSRWSCIRYELRLPYTPPRNESGIKT